MGKKKSSKSFHTPFKALKGVSVSRESKRKVVEKTPEIFGAHDVDDDKTLFSREMELLGVEPQEEHGLSVVSSPPLAAEKKSEKCLPETDEELFLQELGKMDAVFRDQFPEEQSESVPPSPRRMRQLRRGQLVPEGKIDLHGYTRDEAREKVRFFLEDSVFHGKKTVLIITGKGKGSGGRAVLREEMESYLGSKGRAWVLEWGRAPRQYGGEGALVVFLRTQ